MTGKSRKNSIRSSGIEAAAATVIATSRSDGQEAPQPVGMIGVAIAGTTMITRLSHIVAITSEEAMAMPVIVRVGGSEMSARGVATPTRTEVQKMGAYV